LSTFNILRQPSCTKGTSSNSLYDHILLHGERCCFNFVLFFSLFFFSSLIKKKKKKEKDLPFFHKKKEQTF